MILSILILVQFTKKSPKAVKLSGTLLKYDYQLPILLKLSAIA